MLIFLPLPTNSAPNIFTDLPLIYQNKKTTALSNKVKSNVTLIIDNNETMRTVRDTTPAIGKKCRRYTVGGGEVNGNINWRPAWDGESGAYDQFDTDEELDEQIKKEEEKYKNATWKDEEAYNYVRHFKNDCQPGGRTDMRTVQLVLKEMIKKYRDKMRFAVIPVSNFYSETQVNSQFKKQIEQWNMYQDEYNNKKYFKVDENTQQSMAIPSTFFEGVTDAQLEQLLKNIDLLKPQINSTGVLTGTVNLMDALPKIAKDVVMKGQKYRCQKSFLVILSNGHKLNYTYNQHVQKNFDLEALSPAGSSGEAGFWSDGTHGSNSEEYEKWWYKKPFDWSLPSYVKPDAIWDGYFDSDRINGPIEAYFNLRRKYFEEGCNRDSSCIYIPMAGTEQHIGYYTHRLANKNFGPYIYQDDYYQSCIELKYDNYYGLINNKRYRYDAFPRPVGSSENPQVNGPKFFCTGQLGKLTSRKRRETDDAGQPWNAINPQTGRPYTQTAETFAIGMGLKLRPGIHIYYDSTETLYFAATPVGKYDKDNNPDGRFYDISVKYEDLLDTFEDIFKKIYESTTAVSIVDTVAATVGLSSTSEGDASVTATVDTGSWSSQICIHNRGEDPKSCAVQPTYDNRQLVLNDGKNSYLYSSALATDEVKNNNAFKIKDHKADPTSMDPNLSNKNEWRDGLLTWLARAKDDDKIKSVMDKDSAMFVLDYRKRTDVENFGSSRNIGDIINNPLLPFGGQMEGSGHQKYLITSANDGMVYVFGGTNDKNKPYDLKFNYLPLNIQRQSNDSSDLVQHYLKDQTSNEYGQFITNPHRYLLNGGMIVQQTDDRKDGVRQTFMVSTMGQAGRGAFAINIGGKDILTKQSIGVDNMSSADWYKNLELFRTPNGRDNKFGFTVSTPSVARIRIDYGADKADPKSFKHNIVAAAFISNGYNYSDTLASDTERKVANESALYVYNALGADVGTNGFKKMGGKGELIKKIEAEGGKGGLSSPFAFDIDGDNIADIVYAGDYEGNMFRFDIRNPDPSTWRGVKIFAAGKPITIAPLVLKADNDGSSYQKLIVVFGTGSDIYDEDLENLDQQAIYGIYDDYEDNKLVSEQDLLEQTIAVNGDYRTISKNEFTPGRYKGWFMKLDAADGERVVTTFSRLLSTGIVPTRIYQVKKGKIEAIADDPCSSEITVQDVSAKTRMMQFNLKTGAGLTDKSPHIVFDKNHPFGISTMEGLVGFEIISDIVSNIGGTGDWRPLGDTPPSPDKCMDKLPVVGTTEGLIDVENIQNVLCRKSNVTFKRIGWREIREDYSK